jgi:predicted nucleotidyltransferase
MSVHKPQLPLDRLASFCKRHHIAKLALYGSMLTEAFKSSSDVDLLAFFDPAYQPSLGSLVEMEHELAIMIGHRVDLRTPGDLSPYFKDDVLEHMRLLYV